MTPFARYSFSPMTKVPVFPVVNLIAQNDYCTLNFSIQTMPQLTNLE